MCYWAPLQEEEGVNWLINGSGTLKQTLFMLSLPLTHHSGWSLPCSFSVSSTNLTGLRASYSPSLHHLTQIQYIEESPQDSVTLFMKIWHQLCMVSVRIKRGNLSQSARAEICKHPQMVIIIVIVHWVLICARHCTKLFIRIIPV